MRHDNDFNSVTRFSAPWENAGIRKIPGVGSRRVWLHPPTKLTRYWTAAVAGSHTTCGGSRQQALENALEGL